MLAGQSEFTALTKTLVQDVNVKGTFLVTQAFIRLVGSEKRASVINLTSLLARLVVPGVSAYILSKLVSIQLTAILGKEYPNITAVSINPGAVKTDMTLDTFTRFSTYTTHLCGWLKQGVRRRPARAQWSTARCGSHM